MCRNILHVEVMFFGLSAMISSNRDRVRLDFWLVQWIINGSCWIDGRVYQSKTVGCFLCSMIGRFQWIINGSYWIDSASTAIKMKVDDCWFQWRKRIVLDRTVRVCRSRTGSTSSKNKKYDWSVSAHNNRIENDDDLFPSAQLSSLLHCGSAAVLSIAEKLSKQSP